MTEQEAAMRRNLFAFGGDYISFALAMGFLSINIILPSFAAQLGASETLVGTLVTVLMVAWGLPQIIAGNFAARYAQKKTLLVRAALIGRPLTLIVPLVVALTGGQPAGLNLALVLVAYSLFFFTDAFASVPWMNLMSRVFPPERRGTVISRWQMLKALGLLGVSALVGLVLSERGPAFPTNYVLLFAGVSVFLMFSTISVLFINEPEVTGDDEAEVAVPWRELGGLLSQLWRSDQRFRRVTMTRVLFSLSTMAFPFYVLYATETLQFPRGTVGLFILAQTVGASVASLLLGRVVDRRGAERAIQSGGLVALTAPILGLVFVLTGSSTAGPLRYAFAWIYICMGLADNLMMLGFFNYIFDVSPPQQRSVAMGAFNAIGTIGVLGPVIGGWLVGQTSFGVLFAVALGFAVAAQVLAFFLPATRQLAAAK